MTLDQVAGYATFDGQMLDITAPQAVEVLVSNNSGGAVLHVNVGGLCVFRACRIQQGITVNDIRGGKRYVNAHDELVKRKEKE